MNIQIKTGIEWLRIGETKGHISILPWFNPYAIKSYKIQCLDLLFTICQ